MSKSPQTLKSYRLLSLTAVLLLLMLAGCGGSSSSTTTTTQIATITVTPSTTAITVGQNQAFTATVKDSNNTVLSGGVLTWSSSATNVATIDSAGIATGVAAGSTQITVTSEGVTSSAVNLTVTPRVASVTISPMSATVNVGSIITFMAVAKDSSGNPIPGASIQWSCSASSIATIDNNGNATGVSKGTVMITASSGGVSSPGAMLTVQ